MHARVFTRLLFGLWTVSVVAVAASPDEAGKLKFPLLNFAMQEQDFYTYSLLLIGFLSVTVNSALAQVHFASLVYGRAVKCEVSDPKVAASHRDIAHMLYQPTITRVYPMVRDAPGCLRSVVHAVFSLLAVLVALGFPVWAAWEIHGHADKFSALTAVVVVWFISTMLSWCIGRVFSHWVSLFKIAKVGG